MKKNIALGNYQHSESLNLTKESRCKNLDNKLTEWLMQPDGSSPENKETAKQRILEAFDKGERDLWLSSLDLKSIPPLAGLNLKLLDFAANQLEDSTMLREVFSQCPNLEDLYLSDNLLSVIVDEIFPERNKLKSLDLDKNQISVLRESNFHNLKNVHIDLYANHLNESTIQRIINMQNREGYQGPIFHMAIYESHYQIESDITAQNLPEQIKIWMPEGEASHPLWDYAKNQDGIGSLWNNLAIVLTRLNNECPRRKGNLDKDLKANIEKILKAMQKAYLETKNPECKFINSILNISSEAVGTCIDKVKLAYVMMQLQASLELSNNNQEEQALLQQINFVENTISFINNLVNHKVVYDVNAKEFIGVDALIDRYNQQHPDARLLTINEYDETLPVRDKYSAALSLLQENTDSQIKVFNIGDQVEDILNIVYQNTDVAVHKMDMRFKSCCTIKNPEELQAALSYIKGL